MVSKENNIRQCMELVPVLLFFVNLIVYGSYLASEQLDTTLIMDNYYWGCEHLFDGSLITLILMYYICVRDKWRKMSKISLYCLTALWINNIPYVVFGYETGFYFFTFASIIYSTTVVICLLILTNRL